MRAQLQEKKSLDNSNPRINTAMQQDPNFLANKSRFYGA